VQWAATDWKVREEGRAPRFVRLGENHPFPNAPRKACRAYAEELGFEILPALRVPMIPGDFSSHCTRLQSQRADYAFLGNTAAATADLLKDCQAAGVKTQFMVNIWGFDENVMKKAGSAADGVVWVMGAAKWGDEVPGMYTVQEISKMSAPDGRVYRPVQYLRGVCTIFFLKEALEYADKNGEISGPSVRNAIYQQQDWVPVGLDGVCSPATWTPEDHRGVTRVLVYRSQITGPTDDPVPELIGNGVIRMERIFSADIPRRPEWLGW
jgi:branched-chain amino acid transport system substrate-binding protein